MLGLHAILCRKPAAGARQRQLNSVGGSSKSSVSSATTHDDVLKDMVPQLCKPYGLVLECAPPLPLCCTAAAGKRLRSGPPLCVHWAPPSVCIGC